MPGLGLDTCLCKCLQVAAHQGSANMSYRVFLFYGMAATAYSYVISLFAPSQLAAIAMTCIIQAVIAMLYFVG